MSLEVLDRHSKALFEFLWCPVCGQEVFTHIPFEGVFCKNCNTQVVLRESRENRGYEEAVLACFDTDSTWNLHVDEKLRRDLPDGSARVNRLDLIISGHMHLGQQGTLDESKTPVLITGAPAPINSGKEDNNPSTWLLCVTESGIDGITRHPL